MCVFMSINYIYMHILSVPVHTLPGWLGFEGGGERMKPKARENECKSIPCFHES